MAKIFSREKWLTDVVKDHPENERIYKDMNWPHKCEGEKVINRVIHKGGCSYVILDEWCIEQEVPK